jgi:predicted nucleotidyltransferase/HEPN domain-containing protein
VYNGLASRPRFFETPSMRRRLRTLPPGKRRELDRAVEIVEEGFAQAAASRRADRLRDGRILKIILYGSYARGDWVHDPVGRYFSDFDLLVVVDHEDLLDIDFWEGAENRLLEELSSGEMRTPVSLIMHTLDDVNWKLEHGRPFFIDIIREGVVLKDTPGASFVDPQPLPPATALAEAEEYWADCNESYQDFMLAASTLMKAGRNKRAAFNLHQATETLYQGLLLVRTLYAPRSHNLIRLRKGTEPIEPRLLEVWPQNDKFQKRCFELLRAAYVKARYSRHYRITDEELAYLTERVEVLREVVQVSCEEHLGELRRTSLAQQS